jgi:hypothetical protein
MKLMYEDFEPFLKFIGIKSKEWYMQRIVKFVLNMTSYEGEWSKGFYHKYDIHIQDIIPNFVIFNMISDNGELLFEGYDELSEKVITIVADKHLTRRTARRIYRILKSINIFG